VLVDCVYQWAEVREKRELEEEKDRISMQKEHVPEGASTSFPNLYSHFGGDGYDSYRICFTSSLNASARNESNPTRIIFFNGVPDSI
jgi:hypothetical protein